MSQSSVSQGALPECLKRCILMKILNYRRKKSARARRTKYLPVFTSASARVSQLSHSHNKSPSGLSQRPRYAEPQQHLIKNISADTEAMNSDASHISISL